MLLLGCTSTEFRCSNGSVSPPASHDALDLGPALMEVMRETAVSFSTI